MRKVALVLGILLVPALAMGQEVSLSVVSGDYPGPYVSELGPLTGPGDQLVIWTVLEADTNVLDGVQYKLHVNNDADNDAFNFVGYPSQGKIFNLFNAFPGLGDAFDLLGDLTDWAPGDYGVQAPGQGINELNEVIFTNTGSPSIDVGGETLVGYIIEATASYDPNKVYEISALGPVDGGPNAEFSATPENGPITAGSSLLITPEPTSALLLLAAVPFLRRRRA